MESITSAALDCHLASFQREALHLEMRDAYGTAVELPHLRKWLDGEPDDTEWLQDWFNTLRTGTAAGKVFRRARIVSEPVSEYQQWVLKDTHLYIDAGEDIRWVPRRLVSTVPLPGNDFWMFDRELIVFLSFGGNGLVMDYLATTDPEAIGFCLSAFYAVWKLSIPNRDYRSG